MATIQDITSASQYRGDANLGGGTLGVVRLDTKPIEDLARYTIMYNKAEYDQRAKDTQDKIQELSQLTSLDPNSAIKKDRDYLIPRYNEMIKLGQEYARKAPKDNEERVSKFLEYKKQIDGFKKEITSGSARSLAYLKRKNAVANDNTLTPEQKEYRYKKLDDEANATDIFTPIQAEELYDLKQPAIPAGFQRKASVLINTGNTQVEEDFNLFDPQATLNHAYLIASGIDDKIIPKGTAAYNALTPQQKDFQDQLQLASKSNAVIWKNAAAALNTAINAVDANGKLIYRDANGNIDFDAIESANPMVHGIVSLVDRWNEYALLKKGEVSQGIYTDRMGKTVKLKDAVNPKDYFIIDKTKPITPEQLVFLQMFAQSPADDLEKKAHYTGEENTRRNMNMDNEIQWFNAHTSRMNADTAAKNADKKTGTAPAPSEDQFGNIIDAVNVEEMRTEGSNKRFTYKGEPVKIVNGVVTDSKGKAITTGKGTFKIPASALGDVIITEFNKNSGQPKYDADGNLVTDGTGSKIVPDENTKEIVIRIDKGQIVGVKTNNGTFADRNQFADITQKGALKGVTKYKPPTDLGEYNKGKQTQTPAAQDPWDKYRIK